MRRQVLTGLFLAALLAGCGGPKAASPILETEAPRGQLPGGVRPMSYDVALKVDPRGDMFEGQVTLKVWLDEPSDGFWLHGDDLRVGAVSVNGTDATYEEVLDGTGVSRIVFGRVEPAGEAEVRIAYEGDFDKTLAGLFKVEEGGEAYALAKSESIQARRFLPGFDEPGLKATFDIAMVVPTGYQAISNGPVVSRRAALEEGFEEVRFGTTRPLSTYLLSIAAGPFDVVKYPDLPPNAVRDNPVPLRGYAGKGRGGQMIQVLDTTAPLVEIFETAIGQPYPYEKLDIVAAPQWPSGATELAAAITYREERILLDETTGPAAYRAMLNIHSHEIAHMWFGNLVTPPWWDDLWLKEAFATWGTPLALTAFEPDGGHEIDAAVRAISAMRLDSLASTRAVREPIERNEDIRNAYDGITYSKGMAVIAMADAYFGPDVFRPALGKYIAAFADGEADSPDFYDVIGRETGEPAMTDVFRSFIEQKGVPLLSVSANCEAGDSVAPVVTLAQSRYRPLGSEIGDGTAWSVPVCILAGGPSGTTSRTCTILQGTRVDVPLEGETTCPAYIVPNAEGAGYFRWSLPAGGWTAIVDNFNALSPTEALSAVDSAVAAFEAGEGDAASMLAVMEAAARHRDRRVAVAPIPAIRRFDRLLGPGETRAALRSKTRDWYRPRYETLALASGADATVLRDELEAFLALTAGDPVRRARLADDAARFIGFGGERDPSALSSDRYEAALTVAVQDGGAGFFDALLAATGTISDPRFEEARSVALSSARDPALSVRVRELALAGTLGPRESVDLIAGQMQGDGTREETWNWLRENYAAYVKVLPGQWPRQTPSLAGAFCEASRVGELEALFAEVGDLAPGHERALAQTSEAITLCAALKDARSGDLRAALVGEGTSR